MRLAMCESVVLTAGLVSVVLASLTTMFLVSLEIPDRFKVLKLQFIVIDIHNTCNTTQGLPLAENLEHFETELQKHFNLYKMNSDSLAPVSLWTGRVLIGLSVLFGLESLLLIVAVKGQV